MNLALATGPVAQAIGWALLHLLWQGALVAALLAVSLTLLARRSANLRYVLSCAALVLIVVLGVATGIRSYPVVRTDTPTSMLRAEPEILARSKSAFLLAPTTIPWSRGLQDFGRAANDALPALVTIWLAGVALFSVRLVLEWFRARGLAVRSVTPAGEPWQGSIRRLSRALGVRRVVRLLESTAVVVPSVVGFLRPAILLPASALTGLTPAQLEMILAHELAHIRRHDFLANLLQAVVETLLFYHPAVWWISRRVREERENCCDDLAVAVCGSPLQYARTLTRLEELRGHALPLAASANGGSLFERVRRIAGGSRSMGSAERGAAALSALGCVLVALATLTVPAIGQWTPEATQHQEASGSSPGEIEDVASPPPPSEVSTDLHSEDSAIAGGPIRPEIASRAAGSVADATTNHDETRSSDDSDAGDDLDDDAGPAADIARDDAGKPSLDDLIALRVQNVTPETVRAMRALFPGVSLKEIASMSAVGVTPDYVREMRRAGLEVPSAQDATGLAAVGVTSKFLREIRSAGLDVRTASEAQGLAAVGASAEFIRQMRAAGIKVKSTSEARGLAGVGVTPDFVRRLRRSGVELDLAEDAQRLRALGVTPEFVERLARAGYRDLTVEQLGRLGASGLTGDFVREMSRYRSR